MSSIVLALALLGAAPLTLTLDEAVRIGLDRHPEVAAASGQVVAAQAQARQSRAPLLPQLELSGRYGMDARWEPGGGLAPSQQGSRSAGLGASVLLYDFGQTRKRWQAAQSSAEAVQQDLAATKEDVVLAVRLAFLDALEARALVGVARQTLDNGQRHLAQIEEFVRVGARPEIDLARLRTQVATARAELVAAENAERLAKVGLRAAMGVTSSEDFELAATTLPAIAAEERSTDELLAAALRARPELASGQAALEAQEQRVGAADAAFLPALRLGVDGSYAVAGKLPGGVSPWGASAGLMLSWGLFDGLATRAAVEAEQANLSAARARLDGQQLQIWQQLEQARIGVASARAQVAAAEQSAASAAELMRLAEERYAGGVGSALELADAQLELASARAQQVRSEYDLAAARARLLRAVGEREWR